MNPSQSGLEESLNGLTDTPLRILTESKSLEPVGGIELCTFQDALTFARRGHQLHLMFGAGGPFQEQLETARIRLTGPVSFEFNLERSLAGLKSFISPARVARAFHPDVLWLNRFEDIYWATTVAASSRCPIVCQLHQTPNEYRLSRLHRRVAHYVAVSRFIQEAWIDAGLRAERVSVLHNAVPPSEYPFGDARQVVVAKRSLGIPAESPVVLYYGRMMAEKGVGTLLDAWTRVRTTAGDARLVLLGSPSPGDPDFPPELVRKPDSHVHWIPMSTNVVPFLHAADLVVFPSSLPEAFGRVVIESMTTGRPVIASRVGAIEEILNGPMSRFLVEPLDVDGLAHKILETLRWRHDQPNLGSECASWVTQRFSYAKHVKALEEVLYQFSRIGRSSAAAT